MTSSHSMVGRDTLAKPLGLLMYGQGDDELDELELDELLDRERAECVLNFL